MNRRMIKAYFEQDAQYFSESKGEFKIIDQMHPRHAMNAAMRFVREADFYAKEAGMDSVPAELWVTTTPLYRALAMRGMGL